MIHTTLSRRRDEFAAAAKRSEQQIAQLTALLRETQLRIEQANTERLLNNAGQQTCEQLLKECFPNGNGQDQEKPIADS